jgi:thiamine-monophosphate kinase
MFEDRKQKKTSIAGLGEFGLIDRLTGGAKYVQPTTIKGVGDDTAVIDAGAKYMLVTKDLLLEGVHFDMMYYPLMHLGYKAITVNLSDIYAMNGAPTQILAGIGLSSKFSLEAIEEIYRGMYLACEKYSVDLVGGDTSASRQGLVISVTAIGTVDKDKVVYRSGAKPNDLICVSGDLGGAYAGLLLLEREKATFKANPNMQPDLEGNDYILERQLKPEARKDIIRILKELKIKPTSMIDISDGLASELKHLCKKSKTGCNIYEEKIPIDQATYDTARSFNIDPTTCAMNGGEDYELLFTLEMDEYKKIKNLPELTIIGHVTEPQEGINLITRSGQLIEIKAQGWDHLKDETNV